MLAHCVECCQIAGYRCVAGIGKSLSAPRIFLLFPDTQLVPSMLNGSLRILGVLLGLWMPAGNALAWGEEGHRMVGVIADNYLTPEARRQVLALLKYDRLADAQPSQRGTLGEIAYWADEIKDTPWGKRRSAWHFDDIPVCAAVETSQYCKKGACASAQISRHLDMLANKRELLGRKNEALKWVVHLMGDIHQPLHAATHGDRGGNTVQVSFFGERDNPPYGTINLHAIWDVHMVRRLIRDKGGENAIVSSGISDTERAAWERGSISEWVNESHEFARAVVYSSLPVAFSCSGRIERVLTIDQAYYSRAAPLMESQIRKAGIRLARVLNEVFSR